MQPKTKSWFRDEPQAPADADYKAPRVILPSLVPSDNPARKQQQGRRAASPPWHPAVVPWNRCEL